MIPEIPCYHAARSQKRGASLARYSKKPIENSRFFFTLNL